MSCLPVAWGSGTLGNLDHDLSSPNTWGVTVKPESNCAVWNELGSRQEWPRATNHPRCQQYKARGSVPGYKNLRPALLSPTSEVKLYSQGCGRVECGITYSHMQRGTSTTSKISIFTQNNETVSSAPEHLSLRTDTNMHTEQITITA